MDDAPTCRGCGAEVAPGRTWCHPRVRPCLANYRRTVAYRDRTVERDGYDCARCPAWWNRLLLADRTTGRRRFWPWGKRRVAADHIDAIGGTGTHHPTNLQILCEGRPFRHHQRKTRVDVAKMRGRRPPVDIARKLQGVLVLLALAGAWLLGLPQRMFGVTGLDFAADPAGTALEVLKRLAVAAAIVLVLVAASRVRRRMLHRLHLAVAQVTGASATARRPVRVHRWGLVGWRLVPTDVTLRYPEVFLDGVKANRRKVEGVVVAKLGWDRRRGVKGTYAASWDTVRDRVRLRTPDPFVAAAPDVWPGVAEVAHSLWAPVLLGYDRAMRAVHVTLVERNLLIGGIPGSGKSNAMSQIIATAALDPTVRLFLIDLKKVEQAIWRPCADEYADNYDKAVEVLDTLIAIMEQRYEFLMSEHKEKIEGPDDGYELILLAIDELATLTMRGDTKTRAAMAERLRLLVSLGRAAGIICVFATQKPTYDVVPTAVRDLMAFRWAMHCTTSSASDSILGGDASTEAGYGVTAAKIHPSAKGLGYLLAEEGAPFEVRSYFMPTDARQALATRAAHGRGVEPPAFDVIEAERAALEAAGQLEEPAGV